MRISWRIKIGLTLALVFALDSVAKTAGPPADQRIVSRGPLPERNGQPLRGFADYHAHMFSELAFGGLVFWGKAFVPKPEPAAIADALRPCEHTSLAHPITAGIVLATGESAHYHDGYPNFVEWPRYTSTAHQQMYIDSLFRAYQYGLRLVVLTPTNSEVVCNAAEHPLSCNDGAASTRQFEAIHGMADYVATNEGGWLQIATSSEEAARTIAHNRLAVVIGVEVDNLFDCGFGRAGHVCDQAEVIRKLKDYYDQGVRQITPIHLADSAFGGNALYDDRFLANDYYERDSYQATRACAEQGVTWRPLGAEGVSPLIKGLEYANGLGWYLPPYEDPTVSAGVCNAIGLTTLGRFLIKEMMKRGMLVDMEHMSQHSIDDTLYIAHEVGYPVLLSHAWLRDLKYPRENPSDPDSALHWDDQRTEMHSSAETIAKIRALGGVVGVLTNQGYVLSDRSPVEDDCQTSSKSFAAAYWYAHELMGPEGGVGIGTDVNGLAGQPGPRFGANACGQTKAAPDQRNCSNLATPSSDAQSNPFHQSNPVMYDGKTIVDDIPLTRYQVGNRCFDFNYDGMAQYGLIPDMISDLKQIGMPPDAIDTLFKSASAYVAMWKLAESRSSSVESAP